MLSIIVRIIMFVGLASAFEQQSKVPDAVRKAEAKLAESPDDADANLTAGKYHGLDLGDWEKGLPLLSKGADKKLAALAKKDAEGAATAALKIAIADEWADLARKTPRQRVTILDRAGKWYGEAWKELDAAAKPKLRDQLRRLYGLPADPEKRPPSGSVPSSWKNMGDVYGTFPDEAVARTGRPSLRILKPKDPGTNTATTTTFPTKGGKTHEFSLAYLTDGTDVDVPFQVLFFDAGGKQLSKEGGLTMFSDEPWWHRVQGTCDAPEEAVRVMIAVSGKLGKGAAWVDDISLKVEGRELLPNGGLEEK